MPRLQAPLLGNGLIHPYRTRTIHALADDWQGVPAHTKCGIEVRIGLDHRIPPGMFVWPEWDDWRRCAGCGLEQAELDGRAERARLFQVEVSEIAWSLVERSAPGAPRVWKPLSRPETEDVFDRLQRAVTRFAR